ncbi:MAG: hypothetical protein EBY62_08065 [Cellvibrionales bacterium]|nr:hypothetical protein [Cellvibrionales bacterium]
MRDLAITTLGKKHPSEKAPLASAPGLMAGFVLCLVLVGCGGDEPNVADAGAANAQQVVTVETVNTGHPAAGLYSAQCSQCHNGNGSGYPLLKAPSLTTLDAWYVSRQLTHFRDGVRGANEGDTLRWAGK